MAAGDYLNGEVSFWMRGQQALRPARPALTADTAAGLDADVVIVGGGYSGLWTAYHLLATEPHLCVVVLEAEHVGYGASGRNGGWLSQLIPGDRATWSHGPSGEQGVRDLQAAMCDGIREVVAIAAEHGIDIDASNGGNVVVATTAAGLARLRARREADLRYGLPEDRVLALDAPALRNRIAIEGATGGLYFPDVTRIDPAKLVLGLARLVEASGATIFERSRVQAVRPGAVDVGGVTVTARTVLVATEGYGGPLLGSRRLIPVNSSMIATNVLSDDDWARIGWRHDECLSDAAHTFVYAQRTADGRIAIGGRGNPYRFRSGTGGAGVTPAATVNLLLRRLRTYFPGVEFRAEHAWSGVLGVTRDWCTSVSFDPSTRIGHTFGYAGHGVTTAFVAARSLADLARGRDTAASRLPWVGYHSRSWEPEPIRWVGVHSMYRLFRVADAWEEWRGSSSTSLVARFASHLAGLSH